MIYTILSALLFAITFFIPKLSLWTMTLFLVPLHRIGNKKLLIQGFAWGLIVFGAYWYWIIILFKNQSLYNTGITLWILATLWSSLFSAIWIYYFKKYPTISTILFFMFLSKAMLLPLGNLEGMPFLNPLVLLTEYPVILKPLYYISDIGIFTILFGIQNWIASKNNKGIFCLYLIGILFVGLLSYITEKNKRYTIDGAAIITPWWYNQKKGAMFDGYRLAYDIGRVSGKDTKIIITPESTFCFDVQEYQQFVSIWSDSAQNVSILLGTHMFCVLFPHNAIVLLHNNEIKWTYFKQHSVPFMERTVWFEYFFEKPILSCDFIPDKKIINQNDLVYISGKIYQIFVCSEFFLEIKKVWGYPILFLWNDSWLSGDYMKTIAMLFIKYFEIKYRVAVYHVATSGITNIK